MYARYNNYTSCPVSKFELPTKARQFFGSDSIVRQKYLSKRQTAEYRTLLEKLDALDADEQAAMCEKLHELAEELQNSIQTRVEVENSTER
mgnify:CR=1 FL=1